MFSERVNSLPVEVVLTRLLIVSSSGHLLETLEEHATARLAWVKLAPSNHNALTFRRIRCSAPGIALASN